MAPRIVRRFRYFLGGRNSFQLRRTRSLSIGEPYDFRHVLHIGINDNQCTINNTNSEFYNRAQDLKINKKRRNIVNTNESSFKQNMTLKNFEGIRRNISYPDISKPFDFRHLVHVGINQETGDLVGIPDGWKIHLNELKISK